MAFVISAVFYVAIGFHYILQTRLQADGLTWLFFVLFIVWATDSGAYFAGKAFGTRKLTPQISPNKTVEGAVGGVISAVIIGIIFQMIFVLYPELWFVIGVSVVISVFGQLGDLVESAFKRYYHVKDSGNILPGHGGILDRCDSWLFVFPILHIFQLLS